MDKFKERTGIYHEHQQGALCAQHALNNLLQSQMFLADTLADIARQLDADEKSVLTNASFQSENMDDTGFFSIQVLQRALKMFDIELVAFGSQEPIAKQARNIPGSIQAYICNLGSHWFTIRRFGKQYFNLNSLYYAPELITNTMLLAYLKLVEDNGYSVFIVHGTLPGCIGDQQLSTNPISLQEYDLLIKDLPKFIMDGKIIESSKDLPGRKSRRLVVQLPKDLMEEYKKNPDSPHIKQLIYSQLPQDILDEISPHSGCSNPQHNHPRPPILITPMPDDFSDEQFMGSCDCPHCDQHSQGLSPHFTERVIKGTVVDNPNERHREPQMITPRFTERVINGTVVDNPNERHREPQMITPHFTERVINGTAIDNPNERQRETQMITQRFTGRVIDGTVIGNSNEPHREPQIITQHLTQYIIRSNPNNPNEPPQQQVITHRQILIMNRSSQGNNTLMDSDDIRQMTEPSSGLESDDDLLLQHVMARSLLGTSETDEDIHNYFLDDQLEQLNQQLFDKAIAASLTTNNSTIEESKQTPELIAITNMNSPPTPTIDSEPVTIKMPSASSPSPSSNTDSPLVTNTHSPPSTDVNLLPVTNTYSTSPTNTSLPPPANMYSTPPVDTSLPPTTTTNSPPPIVTNVDSVKSPSVEELRQRRLQNNGNRDRSIISKQSDFND